MPLTAPQEEFCRQFVARKFNATEAYLAAYPTCSRKSAQTAGPRLLGNVEISERISSLVASAAADEGITPQRVIRELGYVAFQRAGDVYRPDGSLKSPQEWDNATAATIAGVECDEEFSAVVEDADPQPHGGSLRRQRPAPGSPVVVTRTTKVKRWDKVAALKLFMQHFGLLTEAAPHPDRPRLDLSKLSDVQKRHLLTALRLVLDGAAGGPPALPAGRA